MSGLESRKNCNPLGWPGNGLLPVAHNQIDSGSHGSSQRTVLRRKQQHKRRDAQRKRKRHKVIDINSPLAGLNSAQLPELGYISPEVGQLSAQFGVAEVLMERLIAHEVQQHADRRIRRAERHVDWYHVAAIVVLVAISTLISWFCARLAIRHGWGWWIPFGFAAAFGFLSVVCNMDEIFYYEEKSSDKPDDQQPPDSQEGDGESSHINPPDATMEGPSV